MYRIINGYKVTQCALFNHFYFFTRHANHVFSSSKKGYKIISEYNLSVVWLRP